MKEKISAKAREWLASKIDQETALEINRMLTDKDDFELTDCFYKDLEFGTGGLRGIMGVGSNRMNKYTIGKATQGLSNYLKKSFPNQHIQVAIAYDSRNNSRYFADITADVFSANGIKVFLFEELRPTPELSFAIRQLGCQSGIVITASHNPKEYNGYKAYWSDGAQLTPPHDDNVIAEVNKIQSLDTINFERNKGLVEYIGSNLDEAYIQSIRDLSLSPDIVAKESDLKIVFSPIHGTGITMVPKALAALGFKNVILVEKQTNPDGNFPTVIYPNPEESEAMSLALAKAREVEADLVMATDPDADRVGIAVKNQHGDFQLLNGNQTGSLIIYYLLTQWSALNKIKGKEFVVKTIVTTTLIRRLAEKFKVKCYDTLTGFKYIATLIRELEGKEKFIGGGEESYGYLIGDTVRDKDAVASCAIIAEMTAYAKNKGKSLFELLVELYIQHGFYYESLFSITKKGQKGAEEIQEMMNTFRTTPPSTLAGSTVIKSIDYKTGVETNMENGQTTKLPFLSSNVLQFVTSDDTIVSARPSGTEPKIKFYFSVKSPLNHESDYENTRQQLVKKIEMIKKELKLIP